MKNQIFRVERCSAVGVYRIMSAALDLYRTSFPPGFIRNGNIFYLPTKLFLPTNFTNLHEFISLRYNGDLFGRTNFHEFNIFGCARHNSNKFGSALACTRIH